MTDYTELKRLAELAKEHAPLPYYTVHEADFQTAITPDVVLEMIAEIERHRCGTEVLQRLHDEDMAERNKLRTQNQALLEACKTGLEYVEECLIDYDQSCAAHPAIKAGRGIIVSDVDTMRAAIKLAEGPNHG